MAITRFLTIQGSVTLNINISCEKCNSILEWNDKEIGHDNFIYVKSCENCLEIKRLEDYKNFIQVNIENIGLRMNKSIFCLKSLGINNLRQLLKLRSIDILKIPGSGRGVVKDIKECLAKMNLKLTE